MTTKIAYLWLVIGFFTTSLTWANKKLDKKEHKIDELIELGFFAKAKKQNEKFVSYLNKKKPTDYEEYLAICFLHNAQIKAFLERDEDVFQQDIQQAFSILEKKGFEEQTRGWLKVIQIYLKRGNSLKATKYLDQIASKDVDQLSEKLQEEYFLQQANMYYLSKGFSRAFEFAKLVEKNLNRNDEKYYDDKVHALHLQAKILLDQGYYFQADSLLRISHTYLRFEVHKKSPHQVDYLFLKAIFYDVTEQPAELITYLEEAYFLLEKIEYSLGYANTVYTYEELMEYLCLTHWAYQNENEGDKSFKKYKKQLKKHFGDKGFVREQLGFLEVKRYMIQGDFYEANQLLQSNFSQFLKQTGNDVFRGKILDLKFNIELGLGQLENAEQTLEEYVAVFSKVHTTESTIYHYMNLRLANFYMDYRSNLKQAYKIFKESYFSSAKKDKYGYYDRIDVALAPSHYDHIYFKKELARLFMRDNEIQKAENLYKTIIHTVDHYYGGGYLVTPIQHIEVADFYLNIGKYKEAIFHLKIAEQMFVEGFPEYPEYIDCMKKIAKYFLITQDYQQAKKVLEKAQKANADFQRLNRKMDYEGADDEISEFATLYIHQGQYAKVKRVMNEKIKIVTQNYGKQSNFLIEEYYKLVELYLVQGNYSEAESYILKSLKIAKKSSTQSLDYAKGVGLYGQMYLELGNTVQAMRLFQEAHDIYVKNLGKDNINVAYLLKEMGKASLLQEGINDQTEKRFIASKDIVFEILGNKSVSYMTALTELSAYFLQKGEITTAKEYLSKSKSVWDNLHRESKAPVHLASIQTLEAEIYKYQKEYENALKLYEKVSNSYKKIFDEQHPKYLNAETQVGKLYYILGKTEKAIEILNNTIQGYTMYIQQNFQMLSEKEKQNFWNYTKGDFEFYYSLVLSNHSLYPKAIGNVYNSILNTKAILLNSSLRIRKSILEGDNQQLKELFLHWTKKREEFIVLQGKSEEDLALEGINKDKLIEEINGLEKELSKKSSLFDKKEPTWKQIKHRLEKNEVAIEIVRYRHYTNTFSDSIVYAALIVTSHTKKHPQIVFLPNGKMLENQYYNYYSNVFKYELPDSNSYKQYWKTIEDVIGTNKVIYLSQEGIYNRINVEALEIAGTDKYVVDQNQIILVGNTKDILSENKKSLKNKRINATLFGNPSFYSESPAEEFYEDASRSIEENQTIKNLPGAEKEVNLLKGILKDNNWKIKAFMKEEASEETFKTMEAPSILHIATHGFFYPSVDEGELQTKFTIVSNEAMLKSGLIFKDGGYLIDNNSTTNYNDQQGILTAYEVMNLNLDQTDLVVLSACETGQGTIKIGEGVYGLQRAFLIAGANSIIMSLFQVSDQVTADLMTTFYAQWLKTGEKRASFEFAKNEIRKAHPAPLYWGNFILIEK